MIYRNSDFKKTRKQKIPDLNSYEAIAKIVNNIIDQEKDKVFEIKGFGNDVGYCISIGDVKYNHPVLIKNFSIKPTENIMLCNLNINVYDEGKDIEKFLVSVDGNIYDNFIMNKFNTGIEGKIQGDVPRGKHTLVCLFYDSMNNETIGILNYKK